MNATTLNIERLIQCRQKLGITKQEAAKRMEMSQPAYLRYESGQRIPSIHVIYVMADVLGTSAEYLLNKTDDPTPSRYIINSKNDSDLFEIVKSYKQSDSNVKSRLLAYINKLSNHTDK